MADLRPDIAAAKKNLGFFAWRSWREVNKLEEYLRSTERVLALSAGIYAGGGGLVALTDQRLVFLKDGWFSKTSQDFALSRVSSVEWKSGLFRGKLIIFGDGEPEGVIIDKVWNRSGTAMVHLVREHSGRGSASFAPQQQAPAATQGVPQPSATSASSSAVILDRLAALDRMKDSLGPARYEMLKDKILRGE